MVISPWYTLLSALQVLQENHRLEAKLGIMREQHALVAELLNTQLPAVDAEGDPKGMPLPEDASRSSCFDRYQGAR